MRGFIRADRAALIAAGLFLLGVCVIPTGGATARITTTKRALPVLASRPLAAPSAPLESPPRFFTINRVLAEYDRRAVTSETPRLASLNAQSVTGDPARPPSAAQDEPFGLMTFRAPEGLLWAKWRGVEADIDREAETLAQCRRDAINCASPAALRFLAMVEETRSKAGRERLDAANRLVNGAIRYTSDFVQHGAADLWSAPLASFASGLGDCEDYAIAKYVLLRESGIEAEDMRLLLVRDTFIGQDHAVLAVREEGRWLILDNRWRIVPEASEVRHLMPLFALDHDGVRLFATPYEARLPHESATDLAPRRQDANLR